MSTDKAQRQRREIKYIITEDLALAVRSYLSSYLEPDEFAAGKPDNSYQVHTLYLDSNHLATYRAANDGDRNRFKLRIRYYDDSDYSPVCFEIKPGPYARANDKDFARWAPREGEPECDEYAGALLKRAKEFGPRG